MQTGQGFNYLDLLTLPYIGSILVLNGQFVIVPFTAQIKMLNLFIFTKDRRREQK
jgi:hypothetical protein